MADILPPGCNQDINNEVGSNSISEKDKRISDEYCELLCTLTKKIQTKTTSTHLDTSTIDVCFGDSFTENPNYIYLKKSV